MVVALTFAADGDAAEFATYWSTAFNDSLRAEGWDPLAVAVAGRRTAASISDPTQLDRRLTHCDQQSFIELLRVRRPAIVQSFGDVTLLGPVWAAAAGNGCRIAHFVGSAEGPRGVKSTTRMSRSWATRAARRQSRHVEAVIGSSRSAIARCIEAGFFSGANFSIVAAPPVAAADHPDVPISTSAPSIAPAGAPVLGCYDPTADDAAMKLLVDAIGLAGSPNVFRMMVCRAAGHDTIALPSLAAWAGSAGIHDFIRSIDALVVPSDDDRVMDAVALALRSNKVVIAPTGGAVSELIEYGRHGVVFHAGSAYHLAEAINNVAQTLKAKSFDFRGAQMAVAQAAPEQVARTFACAYERLAPGRQATAGAAERPSASPPIDEGPSVGIVVSARADARLLRGTLRSIGLMDTRPELVIVVTPKGRDHLLDRAMIADLPVPIRVLSADVADDSWLTVGLRAMALSVDVALFAAEGTLFDRRHVGNVKERFGNWDDVVGSVELVANVIPVDSVNDVTPALTAPGAQHRSVHPLLRRWLRARSMMPCVLTARIKACNGLSFPPLSAFCDWISYALFLGQLRDRGRVTVGAATSAAELRFAVERRSGFEFGYMIYNRLCRTEDYSDFGSRIFLSPRLEKLRLFIDSAIQYLLMPNRRPHIATMIRGVLAARHDLKVIDRDVHRDIRAIT
jgi:hypothetical protein